MAAVLGTIKIYNRRAVRLGAHRLPKTRRPPKIAVWRLKTLCSPHLQTVLEAVRSAWRGPGYRLLRLNVRSEYRKSGDRSFRSL
jgi:hypothetical protein